MILHMVRITLNEILGLEDVPVKDPEGGAQEVDIDYTFDRSLDFTHIATLSRYLNFRQLTLFETYSLCAKNPLLTFLFFPSFPSG